jgi:NADPH:quinone reductase-like Zn-dependent oxidoreductase
MIHNTLAERSLRRMKTVQIDRFGGVDRLYLVEISFPEPAQNNILVSVEEAGVGPWDALIRSGRASVPLSLPLGGVYRRAWRVRWGL